MNQQSFNANNRRVWPLERQEDNRLYGPGGGPPFPAAWIFPPPPRNTVMDYGFLEVPTLNQQLPDADSYASLFNAFFLTNLKGVTAGRNLRFWVYEGNSTNPRDLIIGPLGGFTVDRDVESSPFLVGTLRGS